jgi:hypothetical protein
MAGSSFLWRGRGDRINRCALHREAAHSAAGHHASSVPHYVRKDEPERRDCHEELQSPLYFSRNDISPKFVPRPAYSNIVIPIRRVIEPAGGVQAIVRGVPRPSAALRLHRPWERQVADSGAVRRSGAKQTFRRGAVPRLCASEHSADRFQWRDRCVCAPSSAMRTYSHPSSCRGPDTDWLPTTSAREGSPAGSGESPGVGART